LSRVGRGDGGAVQLLDEGIDLVTRLPAWVAALWLTALPCRFLLAAFIVELVNEGTRAPSHGRYLLALSYLLLLLWLPSLYGRQLFVRACRRGMGGETAVHWSGLRVPLRELAGAVSAALLVELLFWGLAFTFVVPAAMVVGALMIPPSRPGRGRRSRATAGSSPAPG